jgi:hypothetical protein
MRNKVSSPSSLTCENVAVYVDSPGEAFMVYCLVILKRGIGA